MSSGLHKDLQPSERHAPHSFEYANAAARTGASGFVAADVGKQALQTDNNSIWLLTAVTPVWLQLAGDGVTSKTKSGRVLVGDFSGAPMEATVTFANSFADTNYNITLTAEGSANKHWSPQYNSKAVGGFTIKLGSNSKVNLIEVSWQAMSDGEVG